MGYEICVGVDEDGGPFNAARALNRAFAQSHGDVVVRYDADGVPDLTRLVELDPTDEWCHLFAGTEYLVRVRYGPRDRGREPVGVRSITSLRFLLRDGRGPP